MAIQRKQKSSRSSGTKKALITLGLLATGLLVFGTKKYSQAKEVLNNLKVGIKKISNVRLTFESINFDATLTIKNTTNIDFGATLTSKIVIKQIRVYSPKGVYLGKANTNIFEIDLPANQTIELPNINFQIDLTQALNEFGANFQNYISGNFNQLTFEIDIEAFGNLITINS